MENSVKEPIQFDDPRFSEIETARIAFRKFNKISESIKWITTFIALAIMVISFAVLPTLEIFADAGIAVMLVGFGVGLFVMFVSTTILNSFKRKHLDTYFGTYYRVINEITYGDSMEYELLKDAKIKKEEFIECNLYKDVFATPSRNLMNLKYKDEQLFMCDCAAQIASKKQLLPVFVGKLITRKNSYASDDGIIIYVKAKDSKLALPPTTTENYKMVEDNDVYSVYSNSNAWNDEVTTTLLNKIKALSVDELLIDYSISIQKGKTFVCLGIDDSLMVIPYENCVKEEPVKHFKDVLNKAVEIALAVK